MSLCKYTFVLGAGALGMMLTQAASAVVVNFESPTYTAGLPIVGQDGWVSNTSYIPAIGGLNGTATVTNASPLAASQSLLYTQTVAPGGGGGGADVSKTDLITIVKDGTSAIDMNVSYLIQVDKNATGDGQVGVFLSANAPAGATTINTLLNSVNSTTGTGILQAGDLILGTPPYAVNYPGGHVWKIFLGADFDTATYTVMYQDITTGGAVGQIVGGAGDGGFRYAFSGAFAADPGDGNHYTVDVGTFLRGGVGRIDDITLTAVPEPATLGLSALALTGMALRRRRCV